MISHGYVQLDPKLKRGKRLSIELEKATLEGRLVSRINLL